MPNSILDIKRPFRAIRYSYAGLNKEAITNHAAFRQEILICAVLIPFAFWLGKNGVEVAVMIGPLLIVPIVELTNSAIETTIDKISTEKNDLSRKAKDLAAAAVLISLVNVLIVWVLIILL